MAGSPPPASPSSGNAISGNAEENSRRTTDERARSGLLAPLGGLYGLAQALTSSERAARRLVEVTYERAAKALSARQAPQPAGGATRAWLFKLMVAAAREAPEDALRRAEAGTETAGAGEEASDRHFRRRAQQRFLRRALPPAFTALAPDQRLLLMLADVEQLTLAEVAEVTGLGTGGVRERTARARADLREALREMAPGPERALLTGDLLPEARLQEALRRMAKRDLTAPPPALRPAARHALSGKGAARAEASPAAAAPPEPTREAPGGSAPDRPPAATRAREEEDASRRRAAASWRQRLPRSLVAFLLIAVAGAAGYLATTLLGDAGETSVAAFSAQQAADVDVRLRTEEAERAEQFVREELGRRLTVPRIKGAALRGVGIAEAGPEARVPVFLFRDAETGRPVAAYAYDYALLDRAAGRLALPPRLRRQIEEEGQFATADVEGRRVLLWRHRDDIFAVVSASAADSLQQRIAL